MSDQTGRGAVALARRYQPGEFPVVRSAVQAIVRMLSEQRASDRRQGRATSTFVSGYQASPLATLDRAVQTLPDAVTKHGIRLAPALNEELAVAC